MNRSRITMAWVTVLAVGIAGPALAAFPKDPLKKCAPDAVVAGTVCMDKYEASVWRVPNALTTNAKLVKKIKQGKATQVDLTAGGATQLGTAGHGDYTPCTDNGQNCINDIYAVSLLGVTPSASITWFQAQAACANAGKRLPSNDEWQAAVTGTPDTGGSDNGTTDCNTDNLVPGLTLTGARTGCVSAFGAYDMVGNLWEWVADWVPLSTACPGWGGFSDDYQCFAGADTVSTGGPGALIRGGGFFLGTGAGPLTVRGFLQPSGSSGDIGFRCAR